MSKKIARKTLIQKCEQCSWAKDDTNECPFYCKKMASDMFTERYWMESARDEIKNTGWACIACFIACAICVFCCVVYVFHL